jgi:hypothetical protein
VQLLSDAPHESRRDACRQLGVSLFASHRTGLFGVSFVQVKTRSHSKHATRSCRQGWPNNSSPHVAILLA